MERPQEITLLKEIKSNARPDRTFLMLLLRRAANSLRTHLYFFLRCRYAKRRGLVRIPWSVTIWAPRKIVEFGDRVQFGPRCVVQCDIKFGNDILIAGDVAFVGRDDHRIDIIGRTIWDSPRGENKETIIEDDVWIGQGAIVLSGVVIGRGSVVAAGSVVTSTVKRYSVVAGVPAKETKKRFTEHEIQAHEAAIFGKNYIST